MNHPTNTAPHVEGGADHDSRFTLSLIGDLFDVLERHGYRQGGDQHVGRSVGMLFRLVTAYECGGDVPRGGAKDERAGGER